MLSLLVVTSRYFTTLVIQINKIVASVGIIFLMVCFIGAIQAFC